MRHHLEALRAYCIDNFSSLFGVSNLELLLEKDGCLLVRSLDDARDEKVVRWGRGGMEKRQEVDWLDRDVDSVQSRTYRARESRLTSCT